jgi:YD repeat-containing protein
VKLRLHSTEPDLDHLSQAGPNGTVSYLYDFAGRRERMSWPDGNSVAYDWNVASQLTHIRENGASSGVGVLAAFTYDGEEGPREAGKGPAERPAHGSDPGQRDADHVQLRR